MVAGRQRAPLPRRGVVVAGRAPIRRQVRQHHPPDAQELHSARPVAGVERAGPRFNGAAEFRFHLIGVHDAPVFFGDAHIRPIQEGAEPGHAVLPLREQERHVESHEVRQRVHAVQQERHDAALQGAEILDLARERRLLALLIGHGALQVGVVAPRVVERLQPQAVLAGERPGFIGQRVHPRLRALLRFGGAALGVEHLVDRRRFGLGEARPGRKREAEGDADVAATGAGRGQCRATVLAAVAT